MTKVELDLPDEVAAVLRDEGRRKAVTSLLSQILRPHSPQDPAPFLALLDEIHQDVRKSGLTEAEVDAELAAYNAEGRD